MVIARRARHVSGPHDLRPTGRFAQAHPTNILAERLKRLEKAGVINRSPYRQRPIRYSYKLTRKGRDLGNILAELVRWGEKHVPGTRRFKD